MRRLDDAASDLFCEQCGEKPCEPGDDGLCDDCWLEQAAEPDLVAVGEDLDGEGERA